MQKLVLPEQKSRTGFPTCPIIEDIQNLVAKI